MQNFLNNAGMVRAWNSEITSFASVKTKILFVVLAGHRKSLLEWLSFHLRNEYRERMAIVKKKEMPPHLNRSRIAEMPCQIPIHDSKCNGFRIFIQSILREIDSCCWCCCCKRHMSITIHFMFNAFAWQYSNNNNKTLNKCYIFQCTSISVVFCSSLCLWCFLFHFSCWFVLIIAKCVRMEERDERMDERRERGEI